MPTSRPIPAQGTLGEILNTYSDIEELKDEMEEWRDNMPEGLQSSDKYSQVGEVADTLGNAASTLEESCNQIWLILEKLPEVPRPGIQYGVRILDTPIKYTEYKMYKGYSTPRRVRLANPCAALEAAMQFVESLLEVFDKDKDMKELPKGLVEELEYHKGQIDNALSDLQNVEFPSMFG